jgi:hypothetical protein
VSRISGKVLLVGSVPFDTPEEVMRLAGETVGDVVSSVPDGEQGHRIHWITMLAVCVFSETPWLETVHRPTMTKGVAGWDSYDNHWKFEVKKGSGPYRLEHLNYCGDATTAYEAFCALRKEGVIPEGVRFQVSLPATESATRWYATNADDYKILYDAYDEAMTRELDAIFNAIPPDDLLIQWDICMEVISVETNDQREGLSTWETPGDPFDRYVHTVRSLSAKVIDEVPMGLHLCYGDLYHRHLVEPRDLSVCVRMANAAVKEVEREIDFIHVPVPRGRDDDGYFAPLRELEVGDARLFLGLMHHSDGLEGNLRRVAAARKFAPHFGVSTECGLGRRPPETIRELLEWHRAVAETLA